MTQVYHGDCLQIMPYIQNQSIDMILCDLPYGTTACKWDTIIPFEPLWAQYKRIIKPHGVIVLTASQPFTTVLIYSNIEWFKYEIIWRKERPTNFMLGRKQILKYHENICIFYNKQCNYNPILEIKPEKNKRKNKPRKKETEIFGDTHLDKKFDTMSSEGGNKNWNYPQSIQYFSMDRGLHPTQKPVLLFEYLIKTYTQPSQWVLDNCAGSGTTAIACMNTNRNYILIEKDLDDKGNSLGYIDIIQKRIYKHMQTQQYKRMKVFGF